MEKIHSFHIPVMGIGFTIDSPIKVAQYGIDSVISLVDDILIERLRKMYSKKFKFPYEEITDKVEDYRAKRITSYLNMVQQITIDKFEALKSCTSETGDAIKEYVSLLPDSSKIKEEFKNLTNNHIDFLELKQWASKRLKIGQIDVNIMTKVDKDNYVDDQKLPTEFNDAHAALRGFANSDLKSSVILSAGMNPRLYSYMSQFDDFFPDENGAIKKKIILKVSDYRSALIQGKFLAKKGLWVSEYRIESGLNCGGHAFATEGYLLGPVLRDFKNNRETLLKDTFTVLSKALISQKRTLPSAILPLKISAQGGVGTQEEHQFLMKEYGIESVGWGSPFLLVPEATTVDQKTLKQLVKSTEKDLYLSDVSPLGIPFNNLKGNTKDIQKQININKNRPGSACPKKFVALNKEFKQTGICTASREYQYHKIKELDSISLTEEEYQERYRKIIEKSCTCVGLGTSALLAYDLDTKVEGDGVSICPGPNMAYYDKVIPLKEMVNHIYGRSNVISREDRPHVFIKELNIYLTYLGDKLKATKGIINKKQEKELAVFSKNLQEGIDYYKLLFKNLDDLSVKAKELINQELEKAHYRLTYFQLNIEKFRLVV